MTTGPGTAGPGYGIDAPGVALALGLAGLLTGAAGFVLTELDLIGFGARIGFAVATTSMLASTALYLHTTLRGKHLVWGELLDRIPWSGDEHLLDLGCGRGAVLVAAARRVPLGRAVGVDLWRTADQSGNSEAAARANAAAAGVGDRVELATGDLIALPFPDACFDVVLSSLAIHNISSARGRLCALDEAVRVMRPGGRLIIVDIIHSRAYGERLIEHGFAPDRRSLGWRYWYGGPWLSAQLVSVRLPDG